MQIMLTVAWSISLLLCVPQAFIFQGDHCLANFAAGWGLKAYVSWFSVSNFFLPLAVLLFCYSRICYDIWENGKLKMEDKKKNSYFKTIKTFVKRRGGKGVKLDNDTQTVVVEDPDAIMAFEKLRRKSMDAESDSSLESADRLNMAVSLIRKAIFNVGFKNEI